jgi:hypothetical protein
MAEARQFPSTSFRRVRIQGSSVLLDLIISQKILPLNIFTIGIRVQNTNFGKTPIFRP